MEPGEHQGLKSAAARTTAMSMDAGDVVGTNFESSDVIHGLVNHIILRGAVLAVTAEATFEVSVSWPAS